ncbi:MAG: hypothetical protein JWP19_1611 [Rhodoglobus sp.]|nr:hypothetical protein [Rhodoglobus sp.]
MALEIEWSAGTRDVLCRVCRFSGAGEVIALVTRAPARDVFCIRCPQCGSLELEGSDARDYNLPDSATDDYIENGASIEAFWQMLSVVDRTTVTSFLEIGSHYGFGLDVATRMFGWDSEGIEPGTAGARGRRDLGVKVTEGYLTETTDLGRTFDLVLASEVIEHVEDPLAFLRAIARQLNPHGQVILTTPSAEGIEPETETSSVIAALSVGFHIFLASAAGLTTLLHEAGFASVAVARDGSSLRAIASLDSREHFELVVPAVDAVALEKYYRERAAAAPAGSALASGMAGRDYRAIVNLGDFGRARAARKKAFALVKERHGLDLAHPGPELAARMAAHPIGWNVASIAYSRAMEAMVHEHDYQAAISYLDVTVAAADKWQAEFGMIDPDSAHLRIQALRHRVLALGALGLSVRGPLRELAAHDSPLSVSRLTARAFVNAVAGGQLELAAELLHEVRISAPQLADSEDDIELGLDSLLSLAMFDLQSANGSGAGGWLDLARTLLDAAPTGAVDAEYATRMSNDIERHALIASDNQAHEAALLAVAPIEEVFPDHPTVEGAVSVILPVYNGARHIRTAIESIVAQGTQPHEVIIIDDGGKDETMSIIASMDLPFPVIMIAQKNAGQSAARNAGIRRATGEFLAFLDQDDQWRHDHIAKLLDLIKSEQTAGWAFSDFDQIDAAGKTVTLNFLAEVGVLHPRRSITALVGSDIMALPSASIMRRSAVTSVGGFDRRLVGYEDDDLFIRMYRVGWTYHFLPTSTVRYRTHSAGSSSTMAFLVSRLIFLKKLLLTIPDDHRLNFFISNDVIFPRFSRATLSDYADALAVRDYDKAGLISRAYRTISRLEGRPGRRRRLKLHLMDHPRRMRAILLTVERLPKWLVPGLDPALQFSHRSVIRAQRVQPDLSALQDRGGLPAS